MYFYQIYILASLLDGGNLGETLEMSPSGLVFSIIGPYGPRFSMTGKTKGVTSSFLDF